MRRRPLSTKERLRLFELHGGVCHLCGDRIDPVRERWDLEHGLAIALGGSDTDDNMFLAHTKRCHKEKTAVDIGMIRKADRQRARHLGAKPRRPQSKWKRRVDGSVVLRNP